MKLKYIVIYILIIFNSGFISSSAEVKKMVADIKQTTVMKVPPLPHFKNYVAKDYVYQDLNDPFNLLGSAKTQDLYKPNSTQTKRPDVGRPKEYLENFPLESLVMVGTLESANGFWGLIVDRSGILHKVKRGDYLGQNSGRIVHVDELGMEINQLVLDDKGGWTNKNVHLKITNAKSS